MHLIYTTYTTENCINKLSIDLSHDALTPHIMFMEQSENWHQGTDSQDRAGYFMYETNSKL